MLSCVLLWALEGSFLSFWGLLRVPVGIYVLLRASVGSCELLASASCNNRPSKLSIYGLLQVPVGTYVLLRASVSSCELLASASWDNRPYKFWISLNAKALAQFLHRPDAKHAFIFGATSVGCRRHDRLHRKVLSYSDQCG